MPTGARGRPLDPATRTPEIANVDQRMRSHRHECTSSTADSPADWRSCAWPTAVRQRHPGTYATNSEPVPRRHHAHRNEVRPCTMTRLRVQRGRALTARFDPRARCFPAEDCICSYGLPRRSYPVLRGALLSGELERGRIPQLIDTSERTARRVISALIDKRLLVSVSHKASLRLGFPIDVVERWFPKLYPLT